MAYGVFSLEEGDVAEYDVDRQLEETHVATFLLHELDRVGCHE